MHTITVPELKQRLDQGEKIHMIDVREAWEYQEFNIGADLIPLGQLQMRVDEISDLKDQEVVVICRSGGRSGAAQGYLMGQGFRNVRNLMGGMMAWQMNF